MRKSKLPNGSTPLQDLKQAAPALEAAGLSMHETEDIRRLLAEKLRRCDEALRMYEPLPSQQAFHASMAPERLLRGSVRGGKTLPAAVECARAVTGQDPFNKYPKTNGRWFCVGKDGRHFSQVMWRKLRRAGPFKMIRDLLTGKWRAFRPWEPTDLVREKETRPAPPLIPPRLIENISWENKASDKPDLVKLRNGWEITFMSSEGKPPQGVDIDGCWFDEELLSPFWYEEMASRLLDRKGRFIWSATPQGGTEQMFDLHERAEMEAGKKNPRVTEHIVYLDENPHIEAVEKDLLFHKLNEDQRSVRIGGEFAILHMRVYPEFMRAVHGIDYFNIPTTWTRYAVVDPGRQICAVLFAAIPPPDKPDHVYIYDELYIHNCDADLFGQRMREKCEGQTFQAFIIDHQGSRVADMGSGMTVEAQYARALQKYKVSSVITGHNFIWGVPDPKAGVEAFRNWLRIRENGLPRLRVMVEKCDNFCKEIKVYRYQRSHKSGATDEPETKGRVHLMACGRYAAMYNPKYVKQPDKKMPVGASYAAFQAKQKKRKDSNIGTVNLGPARKG